MNTNRNTNVTGKYPPKNVTRNGTEIVIMETGF